jgi:NAD(P)-dependent dehydrogenase (short-subunit alcohol dehydrogenase family)
MSLQNTRVLVIGGTSGIGLAIAALAAQRGATPIVASRRQESVDAALAMLPDGAEGATVDITDTESLDALVEQVGTVDHLVHTAGGPLETSKLPGLTPDVVGAFLTTRFTGALNAVRLFAPRLAAGGSITLTTGIAVDKPEFGVMPAAVCGAMNAATTALAFELAPIRVNAVSPGVIRTPLWGAVDEQKEMFDRIAEGLPLRRVGEVEDAALAYVYCMEQTFATGTAVTIDGGALLV